MKWCRYCQSWLSLDSFPVRRASKDGLGYKCKTCLSSYGKAHYRTDEARARAIKRAERWSAANRDKVREIKRASSERNRVKTRDKRNAQARAARQRDINRARLQGRHYASLRRARVRGFVSTEAISKRIAWSGGRCIYCGRFSGALTIDHIEPLARGGKHKASNMLPCCKSCNSSKGTRDSTDWIHERFGVNGLARAIVFLDRITKGRPLPRRLDIALFEQRQPALPGIEISEV